ncbi:MAG: PorV/PorQ family protein, partial [Candidatus Marinimicrobia bacterium]|nr:PorV/PorQ family protein [Candidatus Neomarinimicrobiota bacterium]
MKNNTKFQKRIILLIFSILLAMNFGFAQDKVGTAAAPFLGIPIGGKAIAMGGAFTSIADDATALFWNPGAVSRVKKHDISVSQTDHFLDTKHKYFGVSIMVSPQDAIGIHFNNFDYGDREPVTTINEPNGTGEYWEASDLAIGLSYSRNITDRFSIGGTVKYIEQNIWHESASQFALDLGLLFITKFNGLQIAATLRNFGGELQLDGSDLLNRVDLDPENEGNNENIVALLKTDEFPIPLIYTIGASMPIIDQENLKFILSADAIRPTNNSEYVNV